MIFKRILSWFVWMVVASMATAPAAWAEQPIVIPVILIVSLECDRSNVTGPTKSQTAVYKIFTAGRQPHAAVPNVPKDTGTALITNNEIPLDDCSVRRFKLLSSNHGGSNAPGLMELHLPVLLKVVINGQTATDLSISYAPHKANCQWVDQPRPGGVIPATDLMTGRPTTVRPDYVEEYHRIVRSVTR